MNGGTYRWIGALAIGIGLAGCGQHAANSPTTPAASPGSSGGSSTPAPSATPGSAFYATTTLSGKVYAAKNPGSGSGTPPGYKLAPDGTQVTVQVIGSSAATLSGTTHQGSYQITGVPLHARLLVTASSAGLASRTQQDVIENASGGTLDFAVADDAYLVDQPEVVGVSASPMTGDRLDPDQPLVFTITYSEALNPSTFDPRDFVLTSPDIPGLSISNGDSLLGNTVTVQMTTPTTVVFDTHGPVANLQKGQPYPMVLLSYGQNVLAEAASGVILGGSAQSVGGLDLTGGAIDPSPAIPFRFWTNDSYPTLRGIVPLGPTMVASQSAIAVQLTWSEAMDVMLNAKTASGSYDSKALMPSGYTVATGSSKVGPFDGTGASLQQLTFTSPTHMIGALIGASSGDWVQLTPLCANPEGNAATGSVIFQVN